MAGRKPARLRADFWDGVGQWVDEAARQAELRRAAIFRKDLVQRAKDQALAGARGAQDAFTFGLGDRAYAGVRSLVDASKGADLGDAYAKRMAAERQRDAYDAKHYAAARTAGQAVGIGTQMLATGGIGGAALSGVRLAQGGVRIAEATPLIAREVAVLGAGGGGIGVGGQVISDISQRRLSSAGDYFGAGVGGVGGALAARTGRAGYAGAVDGAATSLAQDILNGRPPSAQHAMEAARAGAALGATAGLLGKAGANRLTKGDKELLGEQVSLLRTWAKGDKTLTTQKIREKMPNGKYTYPDQRTSRELVESKFGRWAKLSKRQREAAKLLDNYRVDHTLPSDIGVAVALPAATFGVLTYDDPRFMAQ